MCADSANAEHGSRGSGTGLRSAWARYDASRSAWSAVSDVSLFPVGGGSSQGVFSQIALLAVDRPRPAADRAR